VSADAMAGDAWWRAVGDGLVVQVRVTPGASRSEVVGVRDGRLAVRVRGRAVEGQGWTRELECSPSGRAVVFAYRRGPGAEAVLTRIP